MAKRRKKTPPWVKYRLMVMDLDDFLTHWLHAPIVQAMHDRKFRKNKVNRWEVFTKKGTHCVSCGLEGCFVVFWVDGGGLHVDLFGYDDNGHEVMMTKDHTFPLSKGGPDRFNNIQPMCMPCNERKGSRIL